MQRGSGPTCCSWRRPVHYSADPPVQLLSRVRLCHRQLPELTQTHVHRIDDAIQPSHPLSSPSPPAFNLSQHQSLFQRVSFHIRWPKQWRFSSSYREIVVFGVAFLYSGSLWFLFIVEVPHCGWGFAGGFSRFPG